jgi:S1-C subfamily serine protease
VTAPSPVPTTIGDVVDFERQMRAITLRIRNVGCSSLGTGSAIAIAPRVIATNRHVIEDARSLEIATWDGRPVSVTGAEVTSDQDLGIVRVTSDLPAVAQHGPAPIPGDPVFAVGFPEGGPFERSDGTVIDYVEGTIFDQTSQVMRITAPLRPGNSGGALLNADGELVGVVFALEIATGYGLVIPAAALESAVAAATFDRPAVVC